MSLEAFGVKNLRCLTDTGLVPIRPITVLVGRNSSGKSTFLRAFPLLRQSVETARNSPILWYHERYVDFGSLKDAASNWLSEPSVTFQFRLHQIGESSFDVAMTLCGREVPFVGEYEIRSEGQVVRWTFDPEGRVKELSVDGVVANAGKHLAIGGVAGLLPNVYTGGNGKATYHPVRREDVGVHIVPGFGAGTHLLGRRSSQMLQVADFHISSFARCVAYLRPLRVSPERAYRIQNLAVDEVDPDGKNLPMFLRSLSVEEAESFAVYTRETLGFEATVKTTPLHAEILVKEGQAKRFVNLVDVGFGYSEVLPLAAILWATCIRPNLDEGGPAPIVAIEQPELHLHPAHQSKLARMLAEAASQSRGSKILVETHSESLINGLGKLIYEGVLKAADVQIVLFDKDDDTGETTVTLAGYRDNGALHDWPYGFLSPVAERRVPSAAE